ncbi:hypothetical protein MUO32_28260 [Shinella sp. CPCC 101442]|uniref:hypothetical protein n=1 Tax=Shinella sp. CPCC 101442 TaxID=2932265 RepID=UPI00215380B8|nr:hypothetical protein [Shinella sp. CPCC 101442]MCR6502925.1 hypothetical protein [Shinella sp. CPCC 101442]
MQLSLTISKEIEMRPQAKPFVVEFKKGRRRKGPAAAGEGALVVKIRRDAALLRRPVVNEVRK